MPMFELVEEASTADIQTSAIRVLSQLGQPRVLDLLPEFVDYLTTKRVLPTWA